MLSYWQSYLDARLGQDEHDDMITEPGALELAQGPVCADSLKGGGSIAALPFLLSPSFAHAASRPTPHEWLGAKRIERGVVCPFVHASTDTQEAC